jgi:DNA-binding transcriptional LysR family regulator
MDRFLCIEAFVRVAETQSFAEAARQLRLSKSAVTMRIQQLEELLGDVLFHRTTRAVRLSEMGQAFFRDCSELVARTNEIVDQMREVRGTPSGTLRVHAAIGFMLGHAAGLLRQFQDRYPEIRLDVVLDDAVIDPVKQGFDVALQIFKPVSDELISRRVFPVRRAFCASPEYLQQHGTPAHPRDLAGHRLGLFSGHTTRDRWTFHKSAEDAVTLELKPHLMSSSVHLLRDYAYEHAGIVCLPTLVASEGICSGRLRIVLPEFLLPSFWLSVVYARTQRGAFKPRLFIESLVARFAGDEPPWDKPLIEAGLLAPDLLED